MSKLARNEMPSGHTRDDFECFGPVATKDTIFALCKMADLGCFKQDEGGSDSNKYYHAAVVQSTKTKKWYLYVEYGRTKDGQPSSPQYQFTECDNEADAMQAFEKQCGEKNTKRGIWEKIGSKERYVPKPKKGKDETEDLYVVRIMASRSVGLPKAKNICNADAAGTTVVAVQSTTKKAARKIDALTNKLFRDLLGGAVKYTRTTMVGNTMPAMSAIEDARDLLQDALKSVKRIGNNLQKQIKDTELKKLTYALYGMIPKSKPLGASEETWILSQDNIVAWQQDLDAFETGLKSASINVEDAEDDVMEGIPADVENIPMTSELGKFLTDFWKNGTRDRHGHSTLKVYNLWRINRHGVDEVFDKSLETTITEMPKKWNNERPLFIEKQKERPDLTPAQRKSFWEGNAYLGFHGTRSVNVPGIIREDLRFPDQLVGVTLNASMFGPGSYFADDWGKSALYCSRSRGNYYVNDGHVQGRHSFMFACDVILGNPYVAQQAEGFTAPPKGHHCVFGKEGVARGWNGPLRNNEWIIYRRGRQRLRYLAEISWY